MSPHPLVEDGTRHLSPDVEANRLARDMLGIALRHLPPYLVVDSRHQIVQFSGGSMAAYLDPVQGAASLGLFDLLNGSLHDAVRAIMEETARTGHEATRSQIMVGPGGRRTRLRITAEVLTHDVTAAHAPDGPLTMVMFNRLDPVAAWAESVASSAPREQPAVAWDEHRRVVEELRSANEELEAARDEMQAAHQEMQAINAELSAKNHEMVCLNADFSNLLDSTQIATLFLDAELRVRNFTPNVADLFALRRSDIGRPVTDLRGRVAYPELAADVAHVLRAATVMEREIGSLDAGHRVYLMRMHPYRRVADSITGVVVTFIDITQRKRAEDRALFLAHHDELTGLANRIVFNATLDGAADTVGRAGQFAGLLYLDLDRFKSVNDAFGHRVGDNLLRMVAIRLRRCVRTGDVVCRLGGDEFAIIQQIREQADATALAARIIASVSAPYDVDGITVRIGVSVGIAWRSPDGSNADDLARAADLALYAAKARGRGNYQVFNPAMRHGIEERRGLNFGHEATLARSDDRRKL